MKKNQEKQDEAAEKLVNDFIRRCNVADSILRYSFRLDMPDVRKMPKQENLVDWVGKSAYELFDPLVEDRPSMAFGVICSGSLNYFDGRLEFFKKNTDGVWSSMARFTSAATQVDKVFFGDLTGDGMDEIIVGLSLIHI